MRAPDLWRNHVLAGTTVELPEPEAPARQHSQLLSEKIASRVAQSPLSFAEYMQMALYEPGFGYYVAGAQKFGEQGDFITAPHISSLFGECVAVQLKEILSVTGGSILELGAGNGKLAGSVLTAMSDTPPKHYFILEPGSELQQRQRQHLFQVLPKALFERVVWLDTLPDEFVGVFIANEVMDALPTEVFVKQDGSTQQLFVTQTGDTFVAEARPASVELEQAVVAIEHELGVGLPLHYQSEVCLLLEPWLHSLASALNTGVMLFCDYGYPRREFFLAERSAGTLACYYRHRQHTNPFFYPGLQDITAHVDFTRVVESASSAGMSLLGYTSQSHFLLDCGLADMAARRLSNCRSEQAQLSLSREVKTLTLPGEMGERFQLMALGKNMASPLQGFSSHDLSHRL